jgi:transposase-like protein
MSYATAEVLGRIERRRRFSIERKLAVLSEATALGANLSEVARRYGLRPAQVYKWRRLAALGVIILLAALGVIILIVCRAPRNCPPLWQSRSRRRSRHCRHRLLKASQ